LSWSIEGFAGVIDDTDGSLVGVDTIAGGNSGTGESADDPAPYATQGLMQLFTGTVAGGRLLKGRTYIPGVTEASNTDGRPKDTYLTDIVAAYNALAAVTDAELLVWSRKNGLSAPVTGAAAWTQWAVLRSRRD